MRVTDQREKGMRKALAWLLLAAGFVGLAGCSTTGFYGDSDVTQVGKVVHDTPARTAG